MPILKRDDGFTINVAEGSPLIAHYQSLDGWSVQGAGAAAPAPTSYSGTQQELADQGLQVSGGQVYSNGQVIGSYNGETPNNASSGSSTPTNSSTGSAMPFGYETFNEEQRRVYAGASPYSQGIMIQSAKDSYVQRNRFNPSAPSWNEYVKGLSTPTQAATTQATAAGSRIASETELAGLSKSDIARTSGVNIYRRDLAKEQSMLGSYAGQYGTPSSDEDWLKFHDYVYEGIGEVSGTDQGVTDGIDSTILKGGADYDFSGVDLGGTGVADSTASAAQQNIQSLLDQLSALSTAKGEELEGQKSELEGKISSILEDAADIPGDQLAAEEAAGIPELRTKLGTVQSKIETGMAEYNKYKADYDLLKTNLESQPMTMARMAGQKALVDRQKLATLNAKAAQLGIYQAEAQGLQGELELAQQTIDRAVDLKYKTAELELAAYGEQLDMIKDNLDSEETKVLMAQQVLLEERMAELNAQKETEKQKENYALQAIAGGATSNEAEMIRNAPDILSAASMANPYMGVAGDLDTQVVTAGGRSLLINKQTGETIRDLGGAYKTTGGGTIADNTDDQFYVSEILAGNSTYVKENDDGTFSINWSAVPAKNRATVSALIDEQYIAPQEEVEKQSFGEQFVDNIKTGVTESLDFFLNLF